jgi:long-chain acyl-CoA synthetase
MLVKNHPRKCALIDLTTGERWPMMRLHDDSLHRAHDLKHAGAIVALAMANSPSWIGTFLAAQKLGKTVLPLDPQQPEAEKHKLAQALGASMLVTAQGSTTLPHGNRHSVRSAALIKLTSGTSGQPRPWRCQASHLLADGRAICTTMNIRPRDKNLGLIPLGHSYGMGNLVMPLILQGTTLALAPDFLPAQLPEWIRTHQLTVFPTVPSILRVLTQLPRGGLHPLRLVISAGARLAPEIAREFHQTHRLKPHNFYGASETGGIVYDRTGNHSLRGDALGQPLEGVRVHITRGNRITVQSKAVLHASGMHPLTDHGMLRPDGALTLMDRTSRVANIGGRKVSMATIERAIRNIPGVLDVLVDVRKNHIRQWVMAAVETQLSRDAIHTALSQSLPPWQMPKQWIVQSTLPRTSRGKIDRLKLG